MRKIHRGDGVYLYRFAQDAYWLAVVLLVHPGDPPRLDLNGDPVQAQQADEWLFKNVAHQNDVTSDDEPYWSTDGGPYYGDGDDGQ